jgi:hypothetical protein
VATPIRAALMAAWGTAALQRDVEVDVAAAALEGSDEPHLVQHGLEPPEELDDVLGRWRDEGLLGLRLALPVPGDPLGLRGPSELNRAAMAAGEAVVAVPHPAAAVPSVPALVPAVTAFGPPGDQGHCVTWRCLDGDPARADTPGLGQADRELREALRSSVDALHQLDATSWTARADRVAALRHGRPVLRLPPGHDPRADVLAEQALGVLAVVDAARQDDGGSLSAHAAAARLAALAPLDRAARRALVAAVGTGVEAALRQPAR